MASTNIYILRLQNGCWYIGKSSNPMKRFEEHLQGQGSAWTTLHKPIACERVISNASAFDEDKYTKEYMAKYGIDKVRGGTYVETELEDEQIATLQKEIWAAQDKCTRCGRTGHFVKDCFATSDASGNEIDVEYVYECEKCNREFDTEREIETHERTCRGNKRSMQTYYSKYQAPKKDTKPSNTCYRCGRAGHYASDCYATTIHSKTSKNYSKSSNACYLCGRAGHYTSDCYATTSYSKRGWYDSDSD